MDVFCICVLCGFNFWSRYIVIEVIVFCLENECVIDDMFGFELCLCVCFLQIGFFEFDGGKQVVFMVYVLVVVVLVL